MAISANLQQGILGLTLGTFNMSAGGSYLSNFANYAADVQTKWNLTDDQTMQELARALVSSPAFQEQMAGKVTAADQAMAVLTNFGLQGDAALLASTTAAIASFPANNLNGSMAALIWGYTKGLMTDAAVQAAYPAAAATFANKLSVSTFLSATNPVATTDVAALKATLATVTADPATAQAVINSSNGSTFTLTENADTATANIFNSTNKFFAGTGYVNTLNDNDRLTGTGTNPTLNVELGASNDIDVDTQVQPTMTGIETVNVQFINSGDSEATLNLRDATGIENVNITRITDNSAAANVTEMDASAANLSLSDATRGGNVTFSHKEEVLTGTADTLALASSNVRLNSLTLNEAGDAVADTGFYFETINMTSTGTNDFDAITVAANTREDLFNGLAAGTTTQTFNLTAGAAAGATGYFEANSFTGNGLETINITANHRVDIAADKLAVLDDSNDGITTNDLETVTITGAANVMIDGLDTLKQSNGNATADAGDKTLTVNAGTMTGNLLLGVATAADADLSTTYAFRADKDVVITSGSGNDQIVTQTNLAGDITTNAGNDLVSVRIANGTAVVDPVSGNIEGVSTINTGTGNDTVTAQDLLATAIDNNQPNNGGFDDVTAATIITGEGDDTVTVRSLLSQQDWDNGVLTDSNADDTYTFKGASIDTGAGNDTVTAQDLAEGASISTGEGNDTFNTELAVATVLAADTVAAAENNLANTADDLLGAVIDLGAGADTANFIDSTSLAVLNTTIVGNDAELRGGADTDVLNVTALDAVTVASRTGTTDVTDTNATITGFETANFTVANQIDAATAAATSTTANDDNEVGGTVSADIARFDTALTAINMVSEEAAMLQNPALEVYEAGTMTTFELSNLRSGIATSLVANEATGVTAGALANDTQLSINTTTGVATATPAAADVRLDVDMVAAGAADTFTLNVGATSGAFDLSMNMYQTNTADNVKTATGTTANMTENVVINFADANAHSVDMNGFGDQQFIAAAAPAVAGDVSSTVATSLTINSAAAAGTGIQVDAVNADTIRFNNADGTAVTAANVTVRVDASNNYNITTGSGTDIIDMRADDVRSDDNATAVNRADIINAGAGRDTMIVGGDDNLGNNQLPGTVPSTTIDDDVFENITSVETIFVDTNDSAAADTQFITLNEAAQGITNVDTVRFVGTDAHTVNMVVGNDFSVAAAAVNGQLTTATSALIIDASAQTGATTLTIESKDDDADVDQVNMDVRVAAKGGAALTFANTGDQNSVVEVRISTSDENDAHTISNANAGNADGLVDINVTTGSIDKIVMVEGATSNDNSGGGANGTEAAMTVTIADEWTRANGTFEFDASAVLNTDADLTTGGATITVAAGDNATLTIRGTQNNDNITGGSQNDTIFGNDGDDVINGGAGADSIDGGTGNDVITGGTGNDTILGGEGDDAITAGLGADNLTGGAGADTFTITAVNESIQSTADSITDFVTGTDKIAITNMTVTNGSTVNLGRFAVVSNSGDGDNSLDGTVGTPKKFDAYYSTSGQLAIDVDGDGDITDINDIVINSTGAINAGDINYTITAAGGDNTVRLGQGVDTITTGAGNDTFVIVGSLDATQVAAYNAAGAGVVGAAASVVNYNDLLSVRTASEANTGDSINAGAGNDILHVFGNANLTGVTLTAIETVVVNSTLTLTDAQVTALTNIVLEGNTAHTITVTDVSGNGIDLTAILAKITANNPGANTSVTIIANENGVQTTATAAWDAGQARLEWTTTGSGVTSGNQVAVTAAAVLDNVAPVFTSATTATINENDTSAANTVIYTAVATDAVGPVTYTVTGADAALLNVNGSQIRVTAANALDFESKASYSFNVVATDAAGNATTQAVTVSVNDLNDEVPVVTLSNITETGFTIASTDADAGSSLALLTAIDGQNTANGNITFGSELSAVQDTDIVVTDGVNNSDVAATLVQGTDNNDAVNGSARTDVLIMSGFGGNDTLTGGSGDDIIFGGDGDDTITAGAGNDILTGGAGNDTFIFSGDFQTGNQILDFGTGTDFIDADVGGGTAVYLNGSLNTATDTLAEIIAYVGTNDHGATIGSAGSILQVYNIDADADGQLDDSVILTDNVNGGTWDNAIILIGYEADVTAAII